MFMSKVWPDIPINMPEQHFFALFLKCSHKIGRQKGRRLIK